MSCAEQTNRRSDRYLEASHHEWVVDHDAVVRLDAAFDRLLTTFARRGSGRVVAAAVLLAYPGFGLLVPVALGWPLAWLISANLVGVVLAASIAMAWLDERVQASRRRHLLEWTSDLRRLNASEFEWLVGELFRRDGWTVTETGRPDGPDGNVDLRLTRDRRQVLVQCKRWVSRIVGVDEIRSFAGTLLRERRPGSDGVFVTLSEFGEPARQEAERLGLKLIDGREVERRIAAARRTEPCPRCGSSMRLDQSSRGWWFRCVALGCAGKRDLGGEPARVVRLLTDSLG